MNSLLVSIITPVYNSEEFVGDCIQSTLNQSFVHFEHILIDDCSSDGSAQIIQSFSEKDSRVKYHKLQQNGGAGVARNKAIELAKGRYIAFLDSDDIWEREKLEKQIRFMKENDCYFSFTSYSKIDEHGKKLNGIVKAKPLVTFKSALYKNPIGCLTAMYDTKRFGKVYMPSIRKRQDFALWLTLLKKENAYGLQESLAYYRVRDQSISSNKASLVKYEWQIYRDFLGLSFFSSVYYLTFAIINKLKTYI